MQRIGSAKFLKTLNIRTYVKESAETKAARLEVIKESRERALRTKITDRLRSQKEREDKRKSLRDSKLEAKMKHQAITKSTRDKKKGI